MIKYVLIFFTFQLSFGQMLSTSGTQIENDSGENVLLRGIGLGGWMLQEGYMMNSNGAADTQHEFKAQLIELIGEEETQNFYDNWLDNFLTESDIELLANSGYNSVRVAMHYNLFTLPIQEEPVQGEHTWLSKGFDMIDDLLDWCEANQIYLILDLHAAPGGQGYDAAISDYNSSLPSLWESDLNKSKTVALWGQLAERYKDEPWIGGYDLINEPNWNLATYELRNLYVQITNAIRAVDTNHIIFIEGNWFANDFTGLTPPWDNNLVYSFHKYWTYNDVGSISWVLDLQNQYNVPLWCGESGENSNVWYTDAIKLFEDHNIGWSWWPFKRIETVVAPFSISSNPKYEAIIDYWRGDAAAPSVTTAIEGLSELTTAALSSNSLFFKDVIDAQIRQPQDPSQIPYTDHNIPGVIHMSDYNLGPNGVAYYDQNTANYSLSTDEFEAWNSGWKYRNDGVDIESNNDNFNSNGYHIGFLENGEWMNYTVNVETSGFYYTNIRYASNQSGGKIRMFFDEVELTDDLTLYSTGGWYNFVNGAYDSVYLDSGTHTFKVKIVSDISFNLGSIEFISADSNAPAFNPVAARVLDDEKTIQLVLNHPLDQPQLQLEDFTVNIDGLPSAVISVALDSNNQRVLRFEMEDYLNYQQSITIDHIGSVLFSTNGSVLDGFTNFPVDNNLQERLLIPGKVEAEAFTSQSGLETEETSDILGGLNIGYTDAGDFAEYLVFVDQTGIYDLSLRGAASSQSGILQLQMITDNSTESLGWFSIPVTGGWQNWITTSHEVELTQGIYKLKMTVLQPGFNLNWFYFNYSESNLSVQNPETEDVSVALYPNPTSDIVNVSLDQNKPIELVEVFDINGRRLFSQYYNEQPSSAKIDLSNFQSGLYVVSIKTKTQRYQKKVLKQ